MRFLKHRVVILSLAMLIWLSAALIPSDNANRSTLASLLNPPARSTAHGRPLPMTIYRTPAGLEAHIEIERPAAAPEGGVPLNIQLFQDLRRRSGLWALTQERVRLFVFDGSGVLSPADWASIPAAVSGAIERDEFGPELFARTHDLVRDGVLEKTRTLHRGYIHNALTAPFALLLSIGLAGLATDRIQRLHEQFHRRRAARRLRHGLCPQCCYDTSSLQGNKCPECGRGFDEP